MSLVEVPPDIRSSHFCSPITILVIRFVFIQFIFCFCFLFLPSLSILLRIIYFPVALNFHIEFLDFYFQRSVLLDLLPFLTVKRKGPPLPLGCLKMIERNVTMNPKDKKFTKKLQRERKIKVREWTVFQKKRKYKKLRNEVKSKTKIVGKVNELKKKECTSVESASLGYFWSWKNDVSRVTYWRVQF